MTTKGIIHQTKSGQYFFEEGDGFFRQISSQESCDYKLLTKIWLTYSYQKADEKRALNRKKRDESRAKKEAAKIQAFGGKV